MWKCLAERWLYVKYVELCGNVRFVWMWSWKCEICVNSSQNQLTLKILTLRPRVFRARALKRARMKRIWTTLRAWRACERKRRQDYARNCERDAKNRKHVRKCLRVDLAGESACETEKNSDDITFGENSREHRFWEKTVARTVENLLFGQTKLIQSFRRNLVRTQVMGVCECENKLWAYASAKTSYGRMRE